MNYLKSERTLRIPFLVRLAFIVGSGPIYVPFSLLLASMSKFLVKLPTLSTQLLTKWRQSYANVPRDPLKKNFDAATRQVEKRVKKKVDGRVKMGRASYL